MHIERMHDMLEKLTDCTNSAINNDQTHIGQYPVGDVVDMIADLSKAEYYSKISKAMDEHEYGEDYDEYGRLGYPQRRDSRGRFMSNRRGFDEQRMWEDEQQRMAEIYDGRMGYNNNMSNGGRSSSNSSSNNRGYSSTVRSTSNMMPSTRYGYSHDRFMDNKRAFSGNDVEGKKMRMESLGEAMDEIEENVSEMIEGMTPEEKQIWKNRMTKILSM